RFSGCSGVRAWDGLRGDYIIVWGVGQARPALLSICVSVPTITCIGLLDQVSVRRAGEGTEWPAEPGDRVGSWRLDAATGRGCRSGTGLSVRNRRPARRPLAGLSDRSPLSWDVQLPFWSARACSRFG